MSPGDAAGGDGRLFHNLVDQTTMGTLKRKSLLLGLAQPNSTGNMAEDRPRMWEN